MTSNIVIIDFQVTMLGYVLSCNRNVVFEGAVNENIISLLLHLLYNEKQQAQKCRVSMMFSL